MAKGCKSIFMVLLLGVSVIVAANMFYENVLAGPKTAEASTQLRKLEFAGASIGGMYYACATAYADVLQKKLGVNVPITVSVTKGSGENIGLIETDRVEAATISSSVLYRAWAGQEPFKRQYRDVRILTRVFANPTVFYALADKNLTKISDLKGKRVGVGAGPKTWDHISRPFLEAHGIDYEKDIKRVYAGFSDLCNQVRDGLLDASIGNVSGGIALLPAIAALAAEKKLVFLEWDPKAIETLPVPAPYFNKQVVSGAVLGRESDYVTLDLGSMQFTVRDDLPEDLVYKMTKLFHENLSDLAAKVKIFQYPIRNPKFMTLTLGDVKFHPGSIRYWKEAGLWQQ